MDTPAKIASGRPKNTIVVSAMACGVGVLAVLGLSMIRSRVASAARDGPTLVTRLSQCRPPANTSKPTIVLVHGAWADASSWDGEVDALQQAGYVALAVANPLEDLATDSATVEEFLKTIPGPIVLVGHSYGGSVITNAAADLPNVKALVYVDAAAPDVGETTGQLSGSDSVLNRDPSVLYDAVAHPGAPAGATDLYLKQNIYIDAFGPDLPRQTDVSLWASQRPVSTNALMSPSQAAAWKTIPSWYFISSGDQIITPAAEMFMAQRARSTITEFRGGSHLTLISQPDAVSSVIGSAICAVR